MTAFTYQLYSSRNFPLLADTLRMLADIGYAHVEGYGALMSEPAAQDALAHGLSDTGLTMPSCHIGLEQCEADLDGVLRIAERFGIGTLVIPYIAPADRPTDTAGWRSYSRRLATLSDELSATGVALAFHNHDFEYAPLADGTLPIDIILGDAPVVLFEFDLAWAARAGVDPMKSISVHGPRIALAHLKDVAPAGLALDEDGWADLGHGTMPWPRLFSALRHAGTRHFVVEHDNPSDHRRFAQRAFDAAHAF